MDHTYLKDVKKIILSSDGKTKGIITGLVDRWCAGCQKAGTTYSVLWEDGKRTFPCPAGCSIVDANTIKIN